MFSCYYCSLQFTTELELNVHTEECRKNMPGPSFLISHICNYCDASFTSAAELAVHDDKCRLKIFVTKMTSEINNMSSKLNNIITDMSQIMTPNQCYYCLFGFHTLKDLIAHRKTCRVLLAKDAVEQLHTSFWEIIEKMLTESSPCAVSATSSSSSSAQKSDVEQDVNYPRYDLRRATDTAIMLSPSTSKLQKSSNKRFSDTTIKCATNSGSSSEPSSPPAKSFRPSNTDVTDIETNREMFHCALCSRNIRSFDAFKTHLLQCITKK